MAPYALPDVALQASADGTKAAYKRAVARFHPDKVAHLGKEFQELAHKKLLLLREAYKSLQGNGRRSLLEPSRPGIPACIDLAAPG